MTASSASIENIDQLPKKFAKFNVKNPKLNQSARNKLGSTTNSVQLYLQEIGRVPLLEREEEVSEAQKVKKYNQIIEARNQAAEAGNTTLQKFNNLIEVRDRLVTQIGHRPSIKRWSTELGIDIHILEEKLAVGKQAWAEVVGFNVKELEKIERDAIRAKAHMIKANLRLVVSLAKKYQNHGLELLDLIQEGTIGLERAVEKFDTMKGYRFSTYSYWWIRQGITRAIAMQGRTIRLPVHITERLNKIKKSQRKISQEKGCNPKIEDIAKELNMSEEKVREALQDIPQSISLDLKVGKNGVAELGDLLETEEESPEENLMRESLQEVLQDLLSQLTSREREVIQMRFGLGDGEPSSLITIGRSLGISRERARQIDSSQSLIQTASASTQRSN